MSLETYTGKIKDLVVTNPTGTDPRSQGDDHLRGIKYTMQQDAVSKTGAQTMEGPLTVTGGLNGQMSSFRNKLINGAMRIGQRGSVSCPAGFYTYALDRWVINPIGAAVTALIDSVSIGVSTSAMRIGTESGLTKVQIGQRIESANSSDLAGKEVTFTAYVYQDTGSQATVDGAVYRADTKDDFSSVTLESFLTIDSATVPSSEWTKVTGKASLTSNAKTGLFVYLNINGSLGGTNKSIYITGVQLEEGAIATPFEQRPIGFELNLCQRYYERISSGVVGFGQCYTPDSAEVLWPFKEQKRAVPIIGVKGSGSLSLSLATGAAAQVASFGTHNPSVSAVGLRCNLAVSSLGEGDSTRLFIDDYWIDASAEL